MAVGPLIAADVPSLGVSGSVLLSREAHIRRAILKTIGIQLPRCPISTDGQRMGRRKFIVGTQTFGLSTEHSVPKLGLMLTPLLYSLKHDQL